MAEHLAFQFSTTGVTVNVWAQEVGGDVVLRFEIVREPGFENFRIDLNGFFIDFGGDGGTVSQVGSRANNMNGGNNNGYDVGFVLGSVGGRDADYESGTITLAGRTLAALEGADAGLRATSFGPAGEGSLKLVADYTPPPPSPRDDFPMWGQDISNVVLVFNTTEGDVNPVVRERGAVLSQGDGFYTVKIDNWPDSANDDLDNSIAGILAWLEANDPVFQGGADNEAESLLLGVIIKGGIQDTNFYAYGANNTNGTAPDPVADGLALSWSGSANPQPANAVDVTYNYDSIWA